MDVLAVRSRGDEQNVDAVARQLVRQRRRIGEALVKTTLDLRAVREHAGFRVTKCFPWPRENRRVVAGNVQLEAGGAFCIGHPVTS